MKYDYTKVKARLKACTPATKIAEVHLRGLNSKDRYHLFEFSDNPERDSVGKILAIIEEKGE